MIELKIDPVERRVYIRDAQGDEERWNPYPVVPEYLDLVIKYYGEEEATEPFVIDDRVDSLGHYVAMVFLMEAALTLNTDTEIDFGGLIYDWLLERFDPPKVKPTE